MPSEGLQAALDDAARVVKVQRTTAERVDACMDQLISLVCAAREQLASGASPGAVGELKKQVQKLGIEKDMNSQTKELHAAVGKLNKSLDRAFDGSVDVCRALRSARFDRQILNQVIAEHFYREGRFELGDQFVAEAGLEGAGGVKAPYVSLHGVLTQLRARNLQPVLQWAEAHRAQLSPDGGPAAFEFGLHALAFIELLTGGGGGGDGGCGNGGGGGSSGAAGLASSGDEDMEDGEAGGGSFGRGDAAAALAYAKAHFPAFQANHMAEIQRYMACIVFAGRPRHSVPPQYAALLSADAAWAALEGEFTRQACSLMGQAAESPLAVVAAAGAAALPALTKMAGVMERSGQDYDSCEQLPTDIQVGPEFIFHSTFACPVSKDQSTPENPPKLLPCGHVLCEQSIAKIADRTRTRVFKCPYCPTEARADNTRELIFPDVL